MGERKHPTDFQQFRWLINRERNNTKKKNRERGNELPFETLKELYRKINEKLMDESKHPTDFQPFRWLIDKEWNKRKENIETGKLPDSWHPETIIQENEWKGRKTKHPTNFQSSRSLIIQKRKEEKKKHRNGGIKWLLTPEEK